MAAAGAQAVNIKANDDASSGTAPPTGSDTFEVTAGQKMLSAITVTPLDVVRVRLQSQNPRPGPSPNLDFTRLTMSTTSLTPAQASELGVTACCREVFFMGNNAEYCLASTPKIGVATTTTSITPPVDCAVQETQRKTYSSTLDGLRKIARNEGVTTLWRGLSPTLVMAVPGNIIYFTGYEWLRYNHNSPFSKMSDDYAPLTGGSVARVMAATAVGPIELVRTRMQAANSSSTGNHMVETFKGLYWWGYEAIRSRLSDVREQRKGKPVDWNASHADRRAQIPENHTETFLDSFASGALSGAFASIVTTPFDVGKTRTQVYRDAEGPQRHMARLLWEIFKTEGVQGLWRGWIPRTLKVAPSCAIMISTYEVGKRVFKGVNERAAANKERTP
ncbi:Mitochondrial carrier protein MTM1 [Emericellopsis cladophorae]|uniref:Mitochondrial carrier protein MTM1 n=1 Tax=Emericellopsis cladophorae TaxID=2686198 RepID=A0A9P9Y3I3_9HYPO|nr:Mitochondrial carrier protein MTM1 [Emericellopsis cladophorae]KAI6782264.1 Mitochondrial carrier protein MTM1 [Emericellopsis cladophorae]